VDEKPAANKGGAVNGESRLGNEMLVVKIGGDANDALRA
jgi:hypothetical protein